MNFDGLQQIQDDLHRERARNQQLEAENAALKAERDALRAALDKIVHFDRQSSRYTLTGAIEAMVNIAFTALSRSQP